MRDVGSVVDFVMSRRHVEKVNLMGWSWGTAIMGLYTTTHNANVARLVLYAPGWLSKEKVPPDAPLLAAYRTVTREAAQKSLADRRSRRQEGHSDPAWLVRYVCRLPLSLPTRRAPSKIRRSFARRMAWCRTAATTGGAESHCISLRTSPCRRC